MNLVFKVVSLKDGKRVSAFSPEHLEVTYPVGQWVSAPVGKLFAFRTFETADVFQHDVESWQIWLAEADGIEPIIHSMCGVARKMNLVIDFWADFWADKALQRLQKPLFPECFYLANVIPGTVVASRVRLLERVISATHGLVFNRLTKELGCGLYEGETGETLGRPN